MGAALKSPPDELRRVVELLDAKDALLERARRAIAASAELRDKIQDGIDVLGCRLPHRLKHLGCLIQTPKLKVDFTGNKLAEGLLLA